jgi:hypothetical protein
MSRRTGFIGAAAVVVLIAVVAIAAATRPDTVAGTASSAPTGSAGKAAEIVVPDVQLLGCASLEPAVQHELHAPDAQPGGMSVAPRLHCVEEPVDIRRVGLTHRRHQGSDAGAESAGIERALEDVEIRQRHGAVPDGADSGPGIVV